MILFPHSKINLGLSVIQKRHDGFHNIETMMIPIGLADILEVIVAPNGKFGFTTSGLKIGGSRDENLVVKAWYLLEEKFSLPAVRIHLHKVIPMGAGLGGGSADAAFLIKSLNTLFKLELNTKQLMEIALELGSDCPFFIENKMALAKGRGELFEDFELNLSSLIVVIVKPDLHINTAHAYSQITPTSKKSSLSEVLNLPMNRWREVLFNDFEKPVFLQYPSIQLIKEEMYKMGAEYTAMSGSGSAVFGLFKKIPDMNSKFSDCFVWIGKIGN